MYSLLERSRRADPGHRVQPNNDFCDACSGKGHFLCCDGGCLRSFHFSCLEPPLELDDVPDESWYCKACRAAKVGAFRPTARHPADPAAPQVAPPKPPRTYFRELIHRVDCENPKAFSLTSDIKGFYKNGAPVPNPQTLPAYRAPSFARSRNWVLGRVH